MSERFGEGIYSSRMAAKIARIRYQSFQAWAKANLLRASKTPIGEKTESTYSYRDLLLIRLIVRLKERGSKPRDIKTALDTIEMMSDGDPYAWMKATILVSSGVVVAVLPGKPDWNPVAASRGAQKMSMVFFPELIKELQNELVPVDRFPHIEVDPRVLGGAPVVKGTRISTSAVVSVQESGEDPRTAYPHLTDEDVNEAAAYEKFLEAA